MPQRDPMTGRSIFPWIMYGMLIAATLTGLMLLIMLNGPPKDLPKKIVQTQMTLVTFDGKRVNTIFTIRTEQDVPEDGKDYYDIYFGEHRLVNSSIRVWLHALTLADLADSQKLDLALENTRIFANNNMMSSGIRIMDIRLDAYQEVGAGQASGAKDNR